MVRHRNLPPGWYPSTAAEVRTQCDQWSSAESLSERSFLSVVVPHAGWTYSGSLAFRTLNRLQDDLDTLVVVGGHLRPSDAVLIAFEDEFETPDSGLEANGELRDWITKAVRNEPDVGADYTVEIQLPLLACIYGDVQVVCVRCPPSGLAAQLAEAIDSYATSSGRRVGVVGSTDLTHYGPAYGFTSHGHGSDALRWVKETNDARVVDSLLRLDPEETIRRALSEQSACSSGAAATSAAFACARGLRKAELIDYYTSYDIQPSDSFVGYAGIGYG